MVSFHGPISFRAVPRQTATLGIHRSSAIPPDPETLSTREMLKDNVGELLKWFEGKTSVLGLTGAGISTESGIPDYRGHNGSYHKGHKPMLHDQFMNSGAQRKRYWGRSMVGWRNFNSSNPNAGHCALADLERIGKIGVSFQDKKQYYGPENEMDWLVSTGTHQLSVITQNVDGLHRRTGMKHVTELHGRTDRLKCMSCGATRYVILRFRSRDCLSSTLRQKCKKSDYVSCVMLSSRSRGDFHEELETRNRDWLAQVISEHKASDLRPDGDGHLARENYDDVMIPACQQCGGFLKPDVVFFGDSVPRHRVNRCMAAVEASDGLLCIGSSLAVHSAFRLVRAAASRGVPIAILNVGETRAEAEGLHVVKIESPAGTTLAACAQYMKEG